MRYGVAVALFTDEVVQALSRALQLDEVERLRLRNLRAARRRAATGRLHRRTGLAHGAGAASEVQRRVSPLMGRTGPGQR